MRMDLARVGGCPDARVATALQKDLQIILSNISKLISPVTEAFNKSQ